MKEKLKIVIKEFHESILPDLIERQEVFDFSILKSPVKKVITIVGPRRAGKTFFLFQTVKKLLKQGVDLSDIIYINFEDERILPMQGADLQLLLEAYFELYEGKESPYVFLDEIQNISGWDKFVRRLNDRGFTIFLTGSNSRMLSREIATSLRGRTLVYELFPFSFIEYLEAKGVKPGKNVAYGKKRHQITRFYDQYFRCGGYPEITFVEDESVKGRIVQDYFNTVFYRDLVERYRIKNTELLRQWLNALVTNVSSLISLTKIENDFRSRGMKKLSRATLSTFAGYVEDVFFGFFVEVFSTSVRKRQVNPKKFYLVDLALHNYLALEFLENRGRLLENLVFLALRRKGHPIFYYKTTQGYEVDFLVKDKGKERLIQVCHDLNRTDTFSREKKALVSGLQELGLKTGTMVTNHEKRVEKVGKFTLNIVPAWEWLLTF
jgi:predicted AAA+ superfamily ATPase